MGTNSQGQGPGGNQGGGTPSASNIPTIFNGMPGMSPFGGGATQTGGTGAAPPASGFNPMNPQVPSWLGGGTGGQMQVPPFLQQLMNGQTGATGATGASGGFGNFFGNMINQQEQMIQQLMSGSGKGPQQAQAPATTPPATSPPATPTPPPPPYVPPTVGGPFKPA